MTRTERLLALLQKLRNRRLPVTAAASAHGKLAAVLPAMFDDDAAIGSPLLVGPRNRAQGDTLGTAREASTRERKLKFDYRDAVGIRTHRIVWPVAIGCFDGSEVVAAWCKSREAFRHFGIEAPEIVDERLPRAQRALLAAFRVEEPAFAIGRF